jgi:hypothetical protein
MPPAIVESTASADRPSLRRFCADGIMGRTGAAGRAGREGTMTYKLDGAKFQTMEELIEALYPLYSDKMTEEEFRKYAEENAEKQ